MKHLMKLKDKKKNLSIQQLNWKELTRKEHIKKFKNNKMYLHLNDDDTHIYHKSLNL